jgi:hypothetical protein
MHSLPATLTIDADVLARLVPGADTALLARVADALASVERALSDSAAIAVGTREAAARLGVCERTLTGSDVPYFRLGGRRLYLLETLRTWARDRQESPGLRAG